MKEQYLRMANSLKLEISNFQQKNAKFRVEDLKICPTIQSETQTNRPYIFNENLFEPGLNPCKNKTEK